MSQDPTRSFKGNKMNMLLEIWFFGFAVMTILFVSSLSLTLFSTNELTVGTAVLLVGAAIILAALWPWSFFQLMHFLKLMGGTDVEKSKTIPTVHP
jgi:hypothetical protein